VVENGSDPRSEIAEQLAGWRSEFHALVDRIGPDEWEGRSGNAGWNVRQVVGHLAAQPDASVRLVGLTRNGRGLLNRAPVRLLDGVNLWAVRITTRGVTPAVARERFDAGHRRLAMLLGEVRDEEFAMTSVCFRQRMTVADAFRELGHQLADHGPQVLAGLASGLPASAPGQPAGARDLSA
jgi:hypothetical protein